MRDGRIDQAKKIGLCLRRVIEYFLRNVDKAYHEALLLILEYFALLDLKKLEFGNELSLHTSHGLEALDNLFNIVWLFIAARTCFFTLFVESKYFLA